LIKKESVFPYLFFLTGFFALLEISFFIQLSKSYVGDFTAVSDVVSIPRGVLPDILYFLFAQTLVHVAYCVLIGLITLLVADLFYLKESRKIALGIGLWLLGCITVMVANQLFFPNSKFSDLTSVVLVNQALAKIVLIFLLLPCGVFILLALFALVKRTIKTPLRMLLALSFIIMIAFTTYQSRPHHLKSVATSQQPNIILIGVDSLRPDFLSHFGADNPTPFFDTFLSKATVFKEAITPLARTFPSWTSILTGLYPKQTGIRSNLALQRATDFSHTLPAILQRHGYETIYATDETRFSNIDKNVGFDRVITPPMGLNDFLIGTLNDFPFSNLLINTPIGKWLFPYSYANRPVYFTYDPQSFIELLRPTLQEQRTKPLFFAAHFCLAHFPYLWSDFAGNKADVVERYEASLTRVDKQVKAFFDLLNENHLLEKAVVVLLSDHGEAFELHGDRITESDSFVPAYHAKVPLPKFYPPSLDNEEIDQSAGHGTDVLGLSQYHSLLAFKLYGMDYTPSLVAGTVSLLDIKPTLLDLLGIKKEQDLPGVSLAGTIQGRHRGPQSPYHLFLESDFTPEAMRTVYPETRKVVLEGIELFQIDPQSMRLTVKEGMMNKIIKSKQYADIYGKWMLALYPQKEHVYLPILINLASGEWTDNLHSSFAQHSPAQSMLTALKAFYGDEIDKV
jgi:arylsulfatase A-like enzyme